MGAAETIQAAIDKLETERARAISGPWWRATPDISVKVFGNAGQVVAEQSFDGDNADLIVTLHRTIDAQLAILRDASEALERVAGLGLDWGLELDLARAIVGEVTPDAS